KLFTKVYLMKRRRLTMKRKKNKRSSKNKLHHPTSMGVDSCSVRAQALTEIGGSASSRTHQLVIDLPEPWAHPYSVSPGFPAGLTEQLRSLAKLGFDISVNGIAADPVYDRSKGANVRVLHFAKPPIGGFAYERQEIWFAPQDLLR